MEKIKNKKGSGHVEIIISFVIFISLITFILIVLRPLTLFSKTGTSDSDITETQILENISTQLSVYSVKIDAVESESCFSIEGKTDENKLIMKDETGNVINAAKQGDLINFEKKSGEFYRIYLSDEFTLDSSPDCPGGIEDGEHVLGVLKTYNVVSNHSINKLFENYNENYPKLKEELGIKNGFNIVVRTKTEELFNTNTYRPTGIEVIARDVPIEILDKQGNLKPVILNIQTWG